LTDPRSIRDQAVKDAKSTLILDAARKIFGEKGFHETRLEDIAAESGFSKASLYNYYADKEEIFLSLAARDFENLLNTLVSIINSCDPFFTNLERLIATSMKYFGEHFAFFVSTTNFHVLQKLNPERLLKHHEEISGKFCSHYFEILALHTKLVEEAQKRGELTTALPAAAIASYISSLVRGTLIEWKLRGEMGDPNRETATLLAFIRTGIERHDSGSDLTTTK